LLTTAALPRLLWAIAVIRRGGFGLATALPSAASPKQAIAPNEERGYWALAWWV